MSGKATQSQESIVTDAMNAGRDASLHSCGEHDQDQPPIPTETSLDFHSNFIETRSRNVSVISEESFVGAMDGLHAGVTDGSWTLVTSVDTIAASSARPEVTTSLTTGGENEKLSMVQDGGDSKKTGTSDTSGETIEITPALGIDETALSVIKPNCPHQLNGSCGTGAPAPEGGLGTSPGRNLSKDKISEENVNTKKLVSASTLDGTVVDVTAAQPLTLSPPSPPSPPRCADTGQEQQSSCIIAADDETVDLSHRTAHAHGDTALHCDVSNIATESVEVQDRPHLTVVNAAVQSLPLPPPPSVKPQRSVDETLIQDFTPTAPAQSSPQSTLISVADVAQAMPRSTSAVAERTEMILDDLSDSDEEEDESSAPHLGPGMLSHKAAMDCDELCRLILVGEDEINSLENADVVLIIGKTGVGKSTLIQLMNGVTMKRCVNGGIAGYRTKTDANVLDGFKIGHSHVSTTHCLRAYKSPDGLIFCDLPGYKDTRSNIIDIATSVWIEKIARVCKSLRFILMIHGATLEEDRGDPFRDLMLMFTKLVNNNPLQISYSVMILFTHMSDLHETERPDKEALDHVYSKIKGIYKDSTKKLAPHGSETMMRMILQLLKDAPKTERNCVRVINPITSDIGNLRGEIKKLKPLENAHQLVRCALSRETSLFLDFMAEKLKNTFQLLLASKVVETEAQLVELTRSFAVLADSLQIPGVQGHFQEIKNEIFRHYHLCKAHLLQVLDASKINTHQLTSNKTEVEDFVVRYKKFEILCEAINVLNDSGVHIGKTLNVNAAAGTSTADVVLTVNDTATIALDFYRTSILMRIDLFERIRSNDPYYIIHRRLMNFEYMWSLHAMFEKPSDTVLMAEMGVQLNAFVSTLSTDKISISAIKSSSEKYVEVDSDQSPSEVTAYMEPTAFAFAFGPNEFRDMLKTDILEAYEQVNQVLISEDIHDRTTRNDFLGNIDKLKSFSHCKVSSDINMDNIDIQFSPRQFGETFLTQFHRLDITSQDDKNTFDLLADKIFLVTAAVESKAPDFFPSTLEKIYDELLAVRDRHVSETVENRVKKYLLNADNALRQRPPDAKQVGQITDLLRTISANIEAVFPLYDKCRLGVINILSKCQEIIRNCCSVLFAAHLFDIDEIQVELATKDLVHTDLQNVLQCCGVIDADLNYSLRWNQTLSTLAQFTDSPQLLDMCPRLEDILKDIQANSLDLAQTSTESRVEQVKLLSQLEWCDSYTCSDPYFVKMILHTVHRGCDIKFKYFSQQLDSSIDIMKHAAILKYVANMEEVVVVLEACPGSSTAAYNEIISTRIAKALREFCRKVNTYLEQIRSIDNLIDPNSKLGLLETFKKNFNNYRELALKYSLDGTVAALDAALEWFQRVLDRLISAPLIVEQDPLALNIDFLKSVFAFEDSMKGFPHLQSEIPRLYNYKNQMSLRSVLKKSINTLISVDIFNMVNEAKDFDSIRTSLDVLSTFQGVDEYIDENICHWHMDYNQRVVAMQSHVHSDIKDRLIGTTFSLVGCRAYLDTNNVPSHAILYGRYTEVMKLIVNQYKMRMKQVNNKEAASNGLVTTKVLGVLREIRDELCTGPIDHMKQFASDIDIAADIDHLTQTRVSYSAEKVRLLAKFNARECAAQINAADQLLEYWKHAEATDIPDNVERSVEAYVIQLKTYLSFPKLAGTKGPSVAGQLKKVVDEIAARRPCKDGINAAYLGCLLEQLSQVKVINAKLSFISLPAIAHQIRSALTNMIEMVLKDANENGAYKTSIDILQNLKDECDAALLRHVCLPNLDNFIEGQQRKLAQYNASQRVWYESREGCNNMLWQLKILKEKTWGWYSSRDAGAKFNELKMQVDQDSRRLQDIFKSALADNNQEKITSIYKSFELIDELLWLYCKVPFNTLETNIQSHFHVLVRNVLQCITARDMKLLQQHFSTFSGAREFMLTNKIYLQSDSFDECVLLHKEITALVKILSRDFDSMVESFRFDNLLDLVPAITGLREFIDEPNTAKYCRTFQRVPYYLSQFIHRTSAIYCRPKGTKEDASLNEMWNASKDFMTEDMLKRKLRQIHVDIISRTNLCVDNNEYTKLKEILTALQCFHLLADRIGGKSTIESTKDQVREIIRGHLESKRKQISDAWLTQNFAVMNVAIKLLLEAEDELQSFEGYVDRSVIARVQEEVEAHLMKLHRSALEILDRKSGDPQERIRDFAVQLIDLGRIFERVQAFRKLAGAQIESILNHCTRLYSISFIFKLGVVLREGGIFSGEEDEEAILIGNQLVSEFRHFKDVSTMFWNQAVAAQHSIDVNLRGLDTKVYNKLSKTREPHEIKREELGDVVEAYDLKYKDLVQKYIKPDMDESELVQNAVEIVCNMQPINLASWADKQKRLLPDLLACIFAFYTINKSGDSYNNMEEGDANDANPRDVLLTPHNIQILTILRLLGVGDSASTATTLDNHLMQIGTGEGKSIILGALATLFALLGFRVRCVCYSEYLSRRDFSDFKSVFDAFKCEKLIKYSKITSFSEDSAASQGNIRQLTENLLHGALGSDQGSYITKHTEQEILLVDEVDVFFGKDFYGQTYNQATQLWTPEISEIVKLIWKHHCDGTKLPLSQIYKSAPYESLMSQFGTWKFFIDNEIALMSSQVTHYNEPKPFYNRELDKIGYQEHDSISYTLSYGYRTVFSYLKEIDEGNVKDNFKSKFDERHLTMQVSCGQFSYCNIKPACILGVSGTLDVLTEYENEVMSRFDIIKFSAAPSVYGKKSLTFDHAGSGILIADTVEDYFKQITDVINQVSRTPEKKKKRSIIVFFESYERLKEYFESTYARQIIEKSAVNRLHEKQDADTRDFIIKKAASLGQVTLATKAFGRGTDFISRDPALNEIGGVYILQTFLSEMENEEIQIKGRSARQGQKGEYSMVLLLRDDNMSSVPSDDGKTMLPKEDTLEYFAISPSELASLPQSKRYEFLRSKRAERRAAEAATIEENLAVADERDSLTRTYMGALLSNETARATELFRDLYTRLKGKHKVQAAGLHVIFMLDESGSMGGSPFAELQSAYQAFVRQRLQNGSEEDRLSVIMFSSGARELAKYVPFSSALTLNYAGGGTCFSPALRMADSFLRDSCQHDLTPILILMTDGHSGDLAQSAQMLRSIDAQYSDKELQAHFVAFGDAEMSALERLKQCVTNGHVHRAAIGELVSTFKEIENSLLIAEYTV